MLLIEGLDFISFAVGKVPASAFDFEIKSILFSFTLLTVFIPSVIISTEEDLVDGAFSDVLGVASIFDAVASR